MAVELLSTTEGLWETRESTAEVVRFLWVLSKTTWLETGVVVVEDPRVVGRVSNTEVYRVESSISSSASSQSHRCFLSSRTKISFLHLLHFSLSADSAPFSASGLVERDFCIGTRYILPCPPPRLALRSFAFHAQVIRVKSLQFGLHCISSKPPHVRRAGNPSGSPWLSKASEVIFSLTVFSSSSRSSLIFFSPSPALKSIYFLTDVGILKQNRSAKQTKWAVHSFDFVAVFLRLESLPELLSLAFTD